MRTRLLGGTTSKRLSAAAMSSSSVSLDCMPAETVVLSPHTGLCRTVVREEGLGSLTMILVWHSVGDQALNY
jgi:hypothetical protein